MVPGAHPFDLQFGQGESRDYAARWAGVCVMKSADILQAGKPPRKKNIHPAVSSRHRGSPCAIKGCSIRTMTASTESLRCPFPSARWETSAERMAEAERAAVHVDSLAPANLWNRLGAR